MYENKIHSGTRSCGFVPFLSTLVQSNSQVKPVKPRSCAPISKVRGPKLCYIKKLPGRLHGGRRRGNFVFWFSRALETAFLGVFLRFAMVFLTGTNCLWNKRCNVASCSTLLEAEKPFCQKMFFLQQKSEVAMAPLLVTWPLKSCGVGDGLSYDTIAASFVLSIYK